MNLPSKPLKSTQGEALMGQLYTIGHSTYPESHFLELLQYYGIQYVLDVRSTPFSKYAPQYNSNNLQDYLKVNGIVYAPMGKYFGARREDRSLYHVDGYLDFEAVRDSDLFIKGKMNVLKGLEKYHIALMCTEKDPFDCHRAILVARGFELDGIDVKHILHDFSYISQEDLNQRLLEKYFPDRGQISLFEEENRSDSDYLKEAYRIRNREIGYRIDHGFEGGEV